LCPAGIELATGHSRFFIRDIEFRYFDFSLVV